MLLIWTSLKFSGLVKSLEETESMPAHIIIPLKNDCFGGVYSKNQPVRLCDCVSVCVKNASFCQSAGGGINLIFSDSSSLSRLS